MEESEVVVPEDPARQERPEKRREQREAAQPRHDRERDRRVGVARTGPAQRVRLAFSHRGTNPLAPRAPRSPPRPTATTRTTRRPPSARPNATVSSYPHPP